MSVFTTPIDSMFAPQQAYYDSLALGVKDYGEQQLQQKQSEIDARQAAAMSAASVSKAVWIVMGIAAVGLIGFAVLKKMHKI